MKTELESFDGLDTRKEIMILLQRLGTDNHRARFLESLIPLSLKGFAGCLMKVKGKCDPVTAYYMLVGITNELGVSINHAAVLLDAVVSGHLTIKEMAEAISAVKCNTVEQTVDTVVYRPGYMGPIV